MVNVFLNDKAYLKIKSIQEENESVSDVILDKLKIIGENEDYFGCLKEKGVANEKEVEKMIKEIKKQRERKII